MYFKLNCYMHSVCFLVYLFINLKKFYFETKLCYMSLAGLELAAILLPLLLQCLDHKSTAPRWLYLISC